jgi:LysR family transcriptional regulator, nitrogen assimilation regulatory protein
VAANARTAERYEIRSSVCRIANYRVGSSWYRVDGGDAEARAKSGRNRREAVLELKQLRYFLAVAEHGAFSKAAMVLSIGQPVLSRHIRCLEEELGMDLLYRNGRGIMMTEAGERVAEHARMVVGAELALRADVDAFRASPTGKLAIGLPPSVAPVMSAPLITRFREKYPHIKLRLQEGFNGHVVEWLSKGRIDVAVLYNAPKASTLITEPLIEEELLLIGPRDTPEALRSGAVPVAKLGELPLILPSHPHGIRILVETLLSTVDIVPNIECEIDSLSTTLQLVERGVGYTILPYASVIGSVNAGQVLALRISGRSLSRQLVLATSTQRPTTLATRALTQAVKQLVSDLVDEGVWMPKDGLAAACRPLVAAERRRPILSVAGTR